MSHQVRISEEYKELIDDIAEQLQTSRKEVLDGILEWFFVTASELEEEEE